VADEHFRFKFMVAGRCKLMKKMVQKRWCKIVERGDKESRTWLVDLKGWKWEVVWSSTTPHDVLLLAIYTSML
jgi:hypothetical protein